MRFQTNRTLLPFLVIAAVLPLHAQLTLAGNDGMVAVPDAPQPAMTMLGAPRRPQDQDDTQQIPPLNPPNPAPRLAKYIEPQQQAIPLSATDKLKLSGWEQLQPYSFGTQILAAGWEHLLNSNPNYGTDKAGFGERLGAATLRQGTQAILADGVFAAVFQQDPRYYRQGSGKILDRVVYAASRVLITRTDSGNEAPNYSQLVGYAGASALTMTYYPAISATWSKTAQGYGISLLGSALGNGVHEFLPDLMRLAFHRH